jgi:GTPase SAR1 family protein
MQPIDAAFIKYTSIVEEVSTYKDSIITEADTRLKVINRILIDVLGWPMGDILTEEKAGSGFLDYKLSINGMARLIVEAKKDGNTFEINGKSDGRAFKLNGPIFKSKYAKEGIEQAINYCGQKNSELACVTNGNEWILFRGSRLGDGRDTLDGVAFVFSTLESIVKNFKMFFELLSYEAIKLFSYRAYFQEAEGQPIRLYNFKKSLKTPQSIFVIKNEAISGDLDKIMTAFFRRLSGEDDPEMLAECFVTSKESTFADSSLLRISEDLLGKIKGLDTENAEKLTEIIKEVKLSNHNAFVIIVGTKGSGKSTFVDRFFRLVLPKDLSEDCTIVKINMSKNDGDENKLINWLNRNLIDNLEKAIFKDGAPEYNELQGMFFDEYKRWKNGTHKYLYDFNKIEFKIEFGRYIERKREDNQHDYIIRIINSIVRVRKKVPCLIFDNADHFSINYQQMVFQYARSIYEQTMCLIIVPITDKTSWQLSQQRALESFESENLFLPVPSAKRVLEKRIEYLNNKISEEKKESVTGYLFTKGITLSIENIKAFTACIQSVFLNTGSTARIIGNLSNADVRRCLELSREIISSPYIKIDDLLKAYIEKNSVEVKYINVKKAIIRGKYNIFPIGIHKFVQNVFSINSEIDTSPLIVLRLLQLLKDCRHDEQQGHKTFVDLFQICDYFLGMNYDQRVVISILDAMLKSGLCLSYDPTNLEIIDAMKIELSPAGFQHLYWATSDNIYVESMLPVTPIVDPETFERLHSTNYQEQLNIFIDYLIKEDNKFTRVPQHEAYRGQIHLVNKIKQFINQPSLEMNAQ